MNSINFGGHRSKVKVTMGIIDKCSCNKPFQLYHAMTLNFFAYFNVEFFCCMGDHNIPILLVISCFVFIL